MLNKKNILILKCLQSLFVAVAVLPTSIHAAPLPLHNSFPTLQPFLGLQQKPLNRDTLLTTSLEHSSVSFFRQNDRVTANFDLEVSRLNLSWQQPVTDDLLLSVDLPVVSYSSGAFDSLINGYHSAFGFPENGRDLRPDNQFLYQFEYLGQPLVQANNGKYYFADARIAVDWLFSADSQWALGLIAEAPLSSGRHGVSNGHWDFAISMAYQQQDIKPRSELWLDNLLNIAQLTSFHWKAGWYLPGDWKGSQQTLAAKNNFQIAAGASVPLDSNWQLVLDVLAQQSPFETTGIRELDSASVTVAAGMQWQADQSNLLSIHFVEDLNTAASADIGLIVGWQKTF